MVLYRLLKAGGKLSIHAIKFQVDWKFSFYVTLQCVADVINGIGHCT